MLARHVVLEYAVTNTIKEHVLRHVSVTLEPAEDDDGGAAEGARYTLRKVIAAPEIGYGDTAQVYAVLERPVPSEGEGGSGGESAVAATQRFENTLKFTVHDVDESSGEVDAEGFPDELALDDVHVRLRDFVRRVPVSSWSERWDALGEATQALTTFGLATVTSIRDGVASLTRLLNLAPCDKSDAPEPNAGKHILYLAGEHVDTGCVLLLCSLSAP